MSTDAKAAAGEDQPAVEPETKLSGPSETPGTEGTAISETRTPAPASAPAKVGPEPEPERKLPPLTADQFRAYNRLAVQMEYFVSHSSATSPLLTAPNSQLQALTHVDSTITSARSGPKHSTQPACRDAAHPT